MNLLFTSVGRRSYLLKYFRDAMEECDRIFAANSTALNPAFLQADESIVTPTIYDSDYIPFLLRYCKEKNISALISLFDIDLLILAANKEKFAEIGTKVIVSDVDFVDICNDKWKTFVFLQSHCFNVPKTYLNLIDVYKDLRRNELNFPLIVKPRWGMGSISVYQADNENELKIFYSKIKKEIQTSYLKYESANNIDESVIIQEKIIGQEYGLDVMNDLEGEYKNTSVKKKISMRSGETDCAITVEDDDLKIIGEKIANISHHIGNLDIDVFKDKEKKIYILEMNARFGGGYPFSHLAGVDLPKAIINWLNGKQVALDLLSPRIGIIGQKDINLICLPEKVL